MQARSFGALYIVALLLAAVAATPALADSPAPPIPYKAVSPHGRMIVEMDVPHDRHPNGIGLARDKATGKIIWRVNFYAHQVLVSDDKVSLVRMGPWASDQKGYTDLAIAFYQNGNMVRKYQVRDLLKNLDTAQHTVSHYFWRARQMPSQFSPDQKRFTLFLIDNTAITFDAATGARLEGSGDAELIKKALALTQEGVLLERARKPSSALTKYQAAYKLWPDPRMKRRMDQLRKRMAKGKK